MAFGLVVLEVEPASPAANASLLPGDILLGTEEKPFTSIDDLSRVLRGNGPRLERLEFLRGDYLRVRRVSVQLGMRFFPGVALQRDACVHRCRFSAMRVGLENVLAAQGVKVAGAVSSVELLADHLDEGEADVVVVDVSNEQLETVLRSIDAIGNRFRSCGCPPRRPSRPRMVSQKPYEGGIGAILPTGASPEQLVAAMQAAMAGLIVVHRDQIDSNFPAARPASSALHRAS